MPTKRTDTCLAKAAEDEPVFVLRGQDMLAGETVREWAKTLCLVLHGASHGYAACTSPKVHEAVMCAQAMDRWPISKIPD